MCTYNINKHRLRLRRLLNSRQLVLHSGPARSAGARLPPCKHPMYRQAQKCEHVCACETVYVASCKFVYGDVYKMAPVVSPTPPNARHVRSKQTGAIVA